MSCGDADCQCPRLGSGGPFRGRDSRDDSPLVFNSIRRLRWTILSNNHQHSVISRRIVNARMRGSFGGLSCRLRQPMLQRIKPCQYVLTMAPTGRASRLCWRRESFQRYALGGDVGLRIVGGRIDAGVSKPATNDGDVNACCYEPNGCRMSKGVRRNILGRQRRRSVCRGRHISSELEPHARCPQRLTVSVHKESLIIGEIGRASCWGKVLL